ncbi:hypothetical protein LCGC14_2271060 [marine sediment metagenome]|uniref:Calcineurin-like phosphoesterase domain-containing protein n=1 Tax=marine sediment metagenome TaxID=412755 RepID=A0A0F9CWY7_9ZZZZ
MKINFQGTVAIIGDTHNPFQDQRALHEVELFLKELQPDLLVYEGDMGDFYQLSKFDKNPARADQLQQDLNSTASMFKRHSVILPHTRKILIPGNHEYRLQRFLWGQSPALASLDCLTVEGLYGLADSGVEIVNYEEGVLFNGVFWATHGDVIRAHSGYAAKGMSDKHGGCGMHGHTHRLGSYYKRDRFGMFGWWENGCLCNLEPDWISHPNWQQGFSLVHFSKTGSGSKSSK